MTRSLAAALLLSCASLARAACEVSLLDAGAGAKPLETIAARLKEHKLTVTHRGKAQTPRELGEVFYGPGCEAAAQKAAFAVRLPTTAVAPLTWKAEREVVVVAGAGLRPSELSLAVASHAQAKVRKLLDAGADPNLGFPLADALWTRDWDLAVLLIERGARLDLPIGDFGAVALTGDQGPASMAKVLIEKAPDAKQAQAIADQLLQASIHRFMKADVEIVKVLLDNSRKLSAAELTQLVCASVARLHAGSVSATDVQQQEQITRVVVERGANLKLRCAGGKSILQHAAGAAASADILEFLIAHGATIGEGADSALFYVDNADAVQVFVAHKADLKVRDKRGRSPLHTARGEAALYALLEAGLVSAINEADNRGFTPLHLTAWHEDVEGSRLLIKRGARVDVKTTAPACWDWGERDRDREVPAKCDDVAAGKTPRDLGYTWKMEPVFGPENKSP